MASTILDAKKLIAAVADVGLCESDPRLLARINEAQRRLADHYNFVVRRDQYDMPRVEWEALTADTDELILDELDATKQMCLALWREENNRLDLAEALEQKAFAYVEQGLITEVETNNKVAWKALLASAAPGTFGYVKARLGLDCADQNLRFTDERIGRLVNDAEERILMKGKPVGSIEEFKFDMSPEGEFYLPDNIEAILFASMHDIPAPVYGRAYDYLEDGPGYQAPKNHRGGWGDVLVDRGEKDGRRRYYVRQHASHDNADNCVRLLCKIRFKPHTTNADKMVVGNYPALKEMALSILAEATDPQQAAVREQLALQKIDDELAEHRGGARKVVNFSVRGASKRFRRIR